MLFWRELEAPHVKKTNEAEKQQTPKKRKGPERE